MAGALSRAAAVTVLAAGVGVGLACGAGLEPEPICAPTLVGVCGTLRFRGTIPDSTDDVFVVAYATFPQNCDDLINNLRSFSSVPHNDSVAAYSVELSPGAYQWVLSVWKKIGMLTLTTADTALLRVAGYYRNPTDTTQPGVITVPQGGAAGGIDFVADFDTLQPATDFVTCS